MEDINCHKSTPFLLCLHKRIYCWINGLGLALLHSFTSPHSTFIFLNPALRKISCYSPWMLLPWTSVLSFHRVSIIKALQKSDVISIANLPYTTCQNEMKNITFLVFSHRVFYETSSSREDCTCNCIILKQYKKFRENTKRSEKRNSTRLNGFAIK